jgi:hypothetical protein
MCSGWKNNKKQQHGNAKNNFYVFIFDNQACYRQKMNLPSELRNGVE